MVITTLKHAILETNIHETETEEKVATAMAFLIPTFSKENVIENSTASKLIGKSGNKITRYFLQIDADSAGMSLKKVLNSLDEGFTQIVTRRFNLKENKLYFRFKKHDLLGGKILLTEGSDVVRVSFKFIIHSPKSDRINTLVNFLTDLTA